MKAIVIQETFGLDNLHLIERPEPPAPSAGQVLLKMKASALNYRDLLMVQGLYNPKQVLPLVPASDGVGEVVAVGDGVTRVSIGDRVNSIFGQGWTHGLATNNFRHITLGGPLDGTLQEFMCLDEAGLVKVPDTLTDEEAATLPCAALTAWNALIEQGNLRPGQTVVIQGTGGVALFALQFAKMAGAYVIITSKSDKKLAQCRHMGADYTINYKENPNWGKEVRKVTQGGADHIIELGGGATLKQSLHAIRPAGTISMIGVLGGPVAEVLLPLVVMQNIRLQGITVGSRTMHEAMIQAIIHNGIRPVIDSVFPLSEAKPAFEHMMAGAHFGKIVIRH